MKKYKVFGIEREQMIKEQISKKYLFFFSPIMPN